MVDKAPDILLSERTESESGAPGEEGWRELVGVISDNAEASIGREFLHNSSQSHLRCRCHGISLVEDDEFKPADRGCISFYGIENLFGAFKGLSTPRLEQSVLFSYLRMS